MLDKQREREKLATRRKSTFYESTLSTIAKKLHKKYPNDHFHIRAETWSRPPSFKIIIEPINFTIWSHLLKKQVQNSVLDRAYAEMVELKQNAEPRDVVNFLKEE